MMTESSFLFLSDLRMTENTSEHPPSVCVCMRCRMDGVGGGHMSLMVMVVEVGRGGGHGTGSRCQDRQVDWRDLTVAASQPELSDEV